MEARASLHERAAARLLRLCERNGGLYTKAGQFIGTASGMPAPFQRELSKLQDSATPLPFEDVRRVVNEALGDGAADASSAVSQSVIAYSASAPRDDVHETSTKHARVFASFDREPVAAASLAQVHRAVTADGDEVAVKVQRPGLRRQFDVDLATMRPITSAVTVAFPSFDFTFLVPEFAERLTRELDFELEGRMCERAGRALADDPRMVTPAVFWPLTTGKVLTMEFVRGAKIDDGPAPRAAGVDPREAAEALADTSRAHAAVPRVRARRPHPGNMLVRRQSEDGRSANESAARRKTRRVSNAKKSAARRGVQIVLLDHGLYTELDEPARRRMCRLWHAVAMRDPSKVRETSEEMGVPPSLRLGASAAHGAGSRATSRRWARRRSARARSRTRAGGGAAARVDGLILGGRPPMTMDQVSEFARAAARDDGGDALERAHPEHHAAARCGRRRHRGARRHRNRRKKAVCVRLDLPALVQERPRAVRAERGGVRGRGRGAAHGPQATVGHGEVRVSRRHAAVGAGGVRVPEWGARRAPARARAVAHARRARSDAHMDVQVHAVLCDARHTHAAAGALGAGRRRVHGRLGEGARGLPAA